MITFATDDFNVLEEKSLEKRHGFENNDQRKEIPEETRLKIKELKTKFEKGEITREQFRKEIKELLPGKTHFEKKGPQKNLPDDVKVKLQELKTRLLNGEISEDQFHKEIDKIMPAKFKDIKMKKDSFRKTDE